jgi:hypothetical protein
MGMGPRRRCGPGCNSSFFRAATEKDRSAKAGKTGGVCRGFLLPSLTFYQTGKERRRVGPGMVLGLGPLDLTTTGIFLLFFKK